MIACISGCGWLTRHPAKMVWACPECGWEYPDIERAKDGR